MAKKKDTARRDETLNLRVPRELKEALRSAAEQDDRSVSSMAVRLLREALAKSGHLEKD